MAFKVGSVVLSTTESEPISHLLIPRFSTIQEKIHLNSPLLSLFIILSFFVR